MAARSKSSSCVSEVEYKSVSYTMTTGNRQKLRLIVVSSAVSRITMHELEVKLAKATESVTAVRHSQVAATDESPALPRR